MSNTTNRNIHLEEMFMSCCSVLQQNMSAETSKETCKRMSSFDCSKKIKEEEQEGDKTGRRRTQGERKEDVKHVKTDLKQEDAIMRCAIWMPCTKMVEVLKCRTKKHLNITEQAADLGHRTMAQFYLGLLYATGQGVTKDESKGEKMADRISSTRIREVNRESQNT